MDQIRGVGACSACGGWLEPCQDEIDHRWTLDCRNCGRQWGIGEKRVPPPLPDKKRRGGIYGLSIPRVR